MGRSAQWWSDEGGTCTLSFALSAAFSYDNEGRMTGETYPTDNNGTTASLSYTFDNMGRLNTMTDNVAGDEVGRSRARRLRSRESAHGHDGW